MMLSKKHPKNPPTKIVVLKSTVRTLSMTSLPVFITDGFLIIHFDNTWENFINSIVRFVIIIIIFFILPKGKKPKIPRCINFVQNLN